MLTKITYIEVIESSYEKIVFSNPMINYWQYQIKINNWLSEKTKEPLFSINENNIENFTLYVIDSDSNSQICQIDYKK